MKFALAILNVSYFLVICSSANALPSRHTERTSSALTLQTRMAIQAAERESGSKVRHGPKAVFRDWDNSSIRYWIQMQNGETCDVLLDISSAPPVDDNGTIINGMVEIESGPNLETSHLVPMPECHGPGLYGVK